MASRLWLTLILVGLVGLYPVDAFADDEDDGDIIFDLDDDEEDPKLERPKQEKVENPPEDPKEDPKEDPPQDKPQVVNPDNPSGLLDLDDDDEEEDNTPIGQLKPGEDNHTLYRAKLTEVEGMSPDEEGMAWTEYLAKYPQSVFRKVIEERQKTLDQQLYSGGNQGKKDAGKAELNFAQGLLLEPIDPRSRFRAGFTWGFPNWINLLLNYEHQLQRNMGVHGGIQRRAGGWNLETGVRYAIIKDTRTNFMLTAIGDLHLNVNPIAPGFRPQIATGKRFNVGEGHIDLQAQVGPDLMLYSAEFSPRLAGGLNLTVSPSDTVEAFIETHTYMKDLGWEEGNSFRFNQIVFGIRFMGKKNPGTGGYMGGGVGATVPYAINYWRHHFGAVIGDFNYYL